MIGMIKKVSVVMLYIVWISLGATLIAYIAKLVPGQIGSLVIIVLLFILTYVPINWFNQTAFKRTSG